MNKSFYFFLMLLQDAFKLQKFLLKTPLTTNSHKFSKLLFNLGFIFNFYTLNNTLIIIFNKSVLQKHYTHATFNPFNFFDKEYYISLKNNIMPFSKFLINSTPSKNLYLSYKQLVNTQTFYALRILSTDKGFLTCNTCIKKKLGGILISTFYF